MSDLLVVVTQNVCLIVAPWKLMMDTLFFPGYICSIKDTLYLFANTLSTLGQKRKQICKKILSKFIDSFQPFLSLSQLDPTLNWKVLATCMQS